MELKHFDLMIKTALHFVHSILLISTDTLIRQFYPVEQFWAQFWIFKIRESSFELVYVLLHSAIHSLYSPERRDVTR